MITVKLPQHIPHEELGLTKEELEREVSGIYLPIVAADDENIFVLIGQNPEPVKIHVSWLLEYSST